MGSIPTRTEKMKKRHKIEDISFKQEKMHLKIDGKEYAFPLSAISKKLAKSSKVEREKYVISPAGYGIHWPLLDEDLSIDGLLGIKHSPAKTRASISA